MSTNQWQCGYCGQHFPVPSLARDHEDAHERDTPN